MIITETKGHTVICGAAGDSNSRIFFVMPKGTQASDMLRGEITQSMLIARMGDKIAANPEGGLLDCGDEVVTIIGEAIEKHRSKLRPAGCDCGSPRCTYPGSLHCMRGAR